jgi:2,4-dienoyl-CoA reductase-like NADH-dependent reductase (Old Yellow Enzyme family)/thioredoxin reductase
MEFRKLFTPMKIGSCSIPNRLAVTAMVTNMCTEGGFATEQYIKYHEAKAKGGFGLIITEDYGINPNAKGYKYVAGLFDDAQIEGHRRLTDTVHKYDTKIFCQIYHAGRQTNHNVNGGVQPVACSPMSCPWNRDMARELTADEINELVMQFGAAAARAVKAGFDGVEIHAGNGYLIAGFMSFYENKRTDEYGGCFDNRMRLLREVYGAVRQAVGPDFPVSVRFSADEHTLSGRDIAESRMVAKLLEEWGVDLINCSNGVYGTYNPGQVAPSFQGHAWTIRNALELKKVVKIPVLGVNSIDDPLMAESLLESEFCDIVGMSRSSLADPEMPDKARGGRFQEIRPCIRCMQGCVSGTYLQIPIRCCVNPELNQEYKYTYENKPAPKKVLIIGGGVAGMQAAIAAARRGHCVTLWEASDKLGGQFVAAAYPPAKGDFVTYTCYMINELKKQGVSVEKKKKATAENVKAFGADKVILATGGLPVKPRIPGADRPNVFYAEDILLGKAQVEGRIIVAGGGDVGVETAMYLADAERGAITVVEMTDKLAAKSDGTRVVGMVRFMKERDIKALMNTKVLEICESGVLVEQEGLTKLLPCDAVVISLGYRPNNALKDELSFLGDKLAVAGDAVECANAMEAGFTGFRAGYYA